MTKAILFYRNSLLTKLFMLVILLVGGGNSAWADTVLKTIDFSDSSWSDVTFSQGASDDPETINGVTFNAKSGTYHFSIADGKLTLPNASPYNGNYFLGFPVEGIVGERITIKVYNGSSSTRVSYTVKDGGTVFSTSDCSSYSSASSGTPCVINVTGLSETNAFVYIARQNSSNLDISKIEVLTPELEDLSENSFYAFYSSKDETAATLISNASLPSYISINNCTNNDSYNSTSTSLETPHDFTALGTGKYYRLYMGTTSNIVIGGLSHVKSIRIYGNGSYASGNMVTTVSKLSGTGSAMTVDAQAFVSGKGSVLEFSTGDLTELTGYKENTYYLYTISFTGSFSLWGLYIEYLPSCTSVAAPTDLSCTAHTKNSLTFGWTAAANADEYTATLYSDSDCNTEVTSTSDINDTSVMFSGLSGNTTYYCKVQSNGDGSTYCAEGNVTAAVSGTTDSKDYTLTVVSNNDDYGTATANTYSLDKDEEAEITAVAETGYKFRSWAVSGTGASLSSTTDNPTTFTMGTENATVTATFSALDTYTITYNKGEHGSGSAIPDGEKTEDVDFTLSSSKYTYSGHVQTGWTTTDGGEKTYDLGGTYTGNEDLALYPYWTETYTITYDKNGGTGYMLATEGVGEINLRANIYTKTGYTFLGWATSQANANAGTVAYADKAAYTLTSNVTLYAVWAESYCEIPVALSGDAPTAGDVVSMQSGAFGGKMKVESTGVALSYHNTNGLQLPYGATTLSVTLNDYMKPGSIISLTLYTSSAGTQRGFDLYSSDGENKIATLATTESGTNTFQYTVESDDNLDGTTGFQLIKTNNNLVYLKFLTVTDCQPGGIISASGWNTYSSNKKLDLSTLSGGTAYVASSTGGGKVKLTTTDGIVAAGTGLMIKGSTGDKFTINTSSSAATLSETNLLVGLPNGGTVTAEAYNYVFGWTDAADPGFYYVNSTEPVLGAGKAYLHVDGGTGARLSINFGDDTPTSINSIDNSQEHNINAYYDLQGRKVKNPTKGLYISNGKKVFVGNKH